MVEVVTFVRDKNTEESVLDEKLTSMWIKGETIIDICVFVYVFCA